VKAKTAYSIVLLAAALLVLAIAYRPESDVDEWLDKLSVIPTPNREKRPLNRYKEILPRAEAGDRDAQYELAKVYEFCALAPDDGLMAAFENAGMSDDKLGLFERNRELCEGFDTAYEDWDEPRDAVEHWTSKALLQGHPIAQAEESIKAFVLWIRAQNKAEQSDTVARAPVRPTSEQEIYAALSHGVEHPEILGYAVRQGYRFFRFYTADEYMTEYGYGSLNGQGKRGPLREAWSIFGCHYLSSCSVENHLDGMSKLYDFNEVDEAVATVLDLYDAILVSDWEKLGLSST
jgi:hypothetical protein